MRYEYPVHLERQADGSVLVTFPDFPEAVTDGADPDEALREAQDALIAALGGYINARRPIPGPSSMKGPQQKGSTAPAGPRSPLPHRPGGGRLGGTG